MDVALLVATCPSLCWPWRCQPGARPQTGLSSGTGATCPALLRSEGALGGPCWPPPAQPRALGSPGPRRWPFLVDRAVGDRRHTGPQLRESREGEGRLLGFPPVRFC